MCNVYYILGILHHIIVTDDFYACISHTLCNVSQDSHAEKRRKKNKTRRMGQNKFVVVCHLTGLGIVKRNKTP